MSEIEDCLKEQEEEFYISDSERVALIDGLVMVAGALRMGKFWFNSPKAEVNQQYITLFENIAKRFANMPVHKEV